MAITVDVKEEFDSPGLATYVVELTLDGVATTVSTPDGSFPKNSNAVDISAFSGDNTLVVQSAEDTANGALDFTLSAAGTASDVIKVYVRHRAVADQDGSSINQDNDT